MLINGPSASGKARCTDYSTSIIVTEMYSKLNLTVTACMGQVLRVIIILWLRFKVWLISKFIDEAI